MIGSDSCLGDVGLFCNLGKKLRRSEMVLIIQERRRTKAKRTTAKVIATSGRLPILSDFLRDEFGSRAEEV